MLETNTFGAREECIYRQGRARLALKVSVLMLETNSFSSTDEQGELVCCWRQNNSLSTIETITFSAKNGTRLTLNANVFGTRDELTRLAIEMNVFHIGDEPLTQS